ncbi:unnamed protein product [Candidula unifasciata]|uniref:G-protein coupled receptors family 1 profile domain-containing protein n=1 Tax=Candidula unifasciata TaxID=100452 RepID=A0A8S3ZQN4_9EUPU|nr:unnamed protein product [Candidula unifasciata]
MSRAGTTEILVAHYLWLIIAPILIIFGTIGNLICVAVMCRRNMRSSNASVYLIALALADTSVLYTGLLRQFIIALTGVDLRNKSNLSCKINSWIVYVALDTSVWILVAFTFERILSVFVPHKVKSYCTRMSSVLIVIGVLIGMMAINGHILYGVDLQTFRRRNNTSYFCYYVSSEYALFFGELFPWLDFSVYCCVPFFILIIGNTCIATRVFLSRRKTRKVAVLDIKPDPKLALKNTTTKRSLKATKRVERISSMTTILLILNSVFLITTTPVSVYFIVRPKLQFQSSFYNSAVLTLVYTVVNLVMYTNNSVNFILYCVTGSRFRKELCGMFRKANISSLERSGRIGQEEDPAGKSSSADRRVPVTQTSEVPFTVEPYPEPDTVHLTSLEINK